MSRARTIVLNTASLTIAQGLTSVAAIFVTGYVARRLEPVNYGEMELAIAFVNFFSPIVFAGIQIPLIKAIINDPQNRQRSFGDALLIRLALTPLFVAVVWLLAPYLVPDVRDTLLWLALANTFLVFYAQSLTVPIEADERMHYMGIGTLIMSVVGMALSVFAVLYGFGPEGVLGARATGMLVCFIYLMIVIGVAFYSPRFRPSLSRYKDYAKRGVPLAFSFLLGLVLLEIDKIMLPHLLPENMDPREAVGLYQSTTVLAYKFEMIIIPFTTAITPPLVAALKESVEAFPRLLGRALRFALILGLPVAVGTGIIALDIMDFVFGDDYRGAVPVLSVLVWFVPLQFINRVMAASVAVDDKERWVAIAVAIAVAANLGANTVLVPLMGITGAAVATIISEALLAGIYIVVMRSHMGGVFRELKLVRVLIAVAVMGIICTLLSFLNAFIIIGLAAVIYGGAILGLKAVTKDELKALRG